MTEHPAILTAAQLLHAVDPSTPRNAFDGLITPTSAAIETTATTETTARPELMSRWDEHSYSLQALGEIKPPEWLIDDLVPRDSLGMIYGPSGHGKTFVSLDMALSVAYGIPWHGHPTRHGRVIYVAAEGVRGIGQRVEAWQANRAPIGVANIEVLAGAVNLAAAGVGDLFAAWCAERQPDLVILDTLARCTVGAEENSARDMGEVVEVLDRIRTATGAAVHVLHHSGKDGAKGARGSTALRGAMDLELEVTAAGATITVATRKAKDAEAAPPVILERINVGKSCALVSSTGVGLLTNGATATLEALRSIEVPGGISATAWCEAADISRSTFFIHRAALVRAGQVLNLGSDKQPRYAIPHNEESEL